MSISDRYSKKWCFEPWIGFIIFNVGSLNIRIFGAQSPRSRSCGSRQYCLFQVVGDNYSRLPNAFSHRILLLNGTHSCVIQLFLNLFFFFLMISQSFFLHPTINLSAFLIFMIFYTQQIFFLMICIFSFLFCQPMLWLLLLFFYCSSFDIWWIICYTLKLKLKCMLVNVFNLLEIYSICPYICICKLVVVFTRI